MRFVAGADIEKDQVVYIGADGKAYPHGQILIKEPTMNKIIPTVGRIVHYWHTDLNGPRAALICHVNTDGSINVAVFSQDGHLLMSDEHKHPAIKGYPITGVRLVQPGESPAPSNPYCTWPDHTTKNIQPDRTEELLMRSGTCILCGVSPSVRMGLPHCQPCSDKIREENRERVERARAKPSAEVDITDKPSAPLCTVCGKPMPPNEWMFNYHGYSGPCPK